MKVNANTQKRTRRTPIGTRNILTVQGKDPNFVYRVVNDTGDRIAQMQEMGYELVSDSSIMVGDRRVTNPSSDGSPVKVSVGGGVQGYVMRIKKEWYEEDQDAKQQRVDQIEAAMRNEAKENSDFGKLQISKEAA